MATTAPSLSSLQASLGKAPAAGKAPVAKMPLAKTPAAKAPVAKTAIAKTPPAKAPVAKTPVTKAPVAKTPAAPAVGQKRPATTEAEGAPPAKKVAVAGAQPAAVAKPAAVVAKPATAQVAKAPLTKQPAAGGAAASPPKAAATAATPATPAAGKPAAVKAPATQTAVASKPPAAGGEEEKAVSAAISNLLAAIEAAPAAAKPQGVATLADALGSKLQIDHINQFLRTLKKKVIERAQGDGIRVQATSQKAKAAAPGATVVAKGGAAPPAPDAAPGPAPGAAVVAKGSTAVANGASVVAKGVPAAAKGATVVGKAAAAKSSLVKQPAAAPAPAVAPAAPAKAPVAKVAAAATPAKVAAAAAPAKVAAATAPAKVAAAPAPAKVAAAKPPAAKAPPAPPAPAAEEPPPPAEVEDPLYALIGSLVKDPVHSGGELNQERLSAVLKQLWDGTAKRPKDWAAVWQKMGIPVEKQSEAVQRFFNMTFSIEGQEPEKAPSVMAELVKAHRVKLRSVEEVLVTFGHNLDGLLALNEEAWHAYSYFLMHVFPKPASAGWGWSRVGWSWASWWQFVEKCVTSLEASRQFEVIALLLKLIQDREGTALGEVQTWQDGDKLGKVIAKLGEMCEMADGEVVEKLAEAGVTVD